MGFRLNAVHVSLLCCAAFFVAFWLVRVGYEHWQFNQISTPEQLSVAWKEARREDRMKYLNLLLRQDWESKFASAKGHMQAEARKSLLWDMTRDEVRGFLGRPDSKDEKKHSYFVGATGIMTNLYLRVYFDEDTGKVNRIDLIE